MNDVMLGFCSFLLLAAVLTGCSYSSPAGQQLEITERLREMAQDILATQLTSMASITEQQSCTIIVVGYASL
jgi:hypothetical protein